MKEYLLFILLSIFCVFCEYYFYERKCYPYNNVEIKNKRTKNLQNLILLLLFCMLLVLFIFRDLSVGTDTVTYKDMFDSFDVRNPKFSTEPIFWIIVYIVKLFNLPFTSVLFCVGVIFLGSVFVFIKKNSPLKFLSLFLFFCLGVIPTSFNAMRQYLALSFFLYAIIDLKKNNIFGYIVFCLLATLSHNTAIVLFPLFLIKYIKLNIKTILIVIGLTIVSILALPYGVKLISSISSRNYYEMYMTAGLFKNNINIIHILYDLTLVFSFVWLYCFKRNMPKSVIKIYDIYLWLFLAVICIRTIANLSGFVVITNRLQIYFFWSLCILIPYTVRYYNIKRFNVEYKYAVVVLSLIYFYLTIVWRKQSEISNYRFSVMFPGNILLYVSLFLLSIGAITLELISIKCKSSKYN